MASYGGYASLMAWRKSLACMGAAGYVNYDLPKRQNDLKGASARPGNWAADWM
jgi:hypothetical protein